MSIHGHGSVNIEQLKEWAKLLDVEQILNKTKSGLYGRYVSEEICRGIFDRFLHCIENLSETDYWYDKTMSILNRALIPTVFMVADNSIRVANFYEITVVAADIETKKKLIKGFAADDSDAAYELELFNRLENNEFNDKDIPQIICGFVAFAKSNFKVSNHIWQAVKGLQSVYD